MTRDNQIIQASEEWTYQTPPQYSELVHKSPKVMCAYQVGFIDGAVWADEHPDWIRVEDELPPRLDEDLDISITVIVCDEVNIGFGEYDFDKLKWFSDIRSVTHWMPIPKPPKKGK